MGRNLILIYFFFKHNFNELLCTLINPAGPKYQCSKQSHTNQSLFHLSSRTGVSGPPEMGIPRALTVTVNYRKLPTQNYLRGLGKQGCKENPGISVWVLVLGGCQESRPCAPSLCHSPADLYPSPTGSLLIIPNAFPFIAFSLLYFCLISIN